MCCLSQLRIRKKERKGNGTHHAPQPVKTTTGKEELEDMIGIFGSRYRPERKRMKGARDNNC